MNAVTRLALYGAGLVVAFGAAFVIAGAVVPTDIVAAWEQRATQSHPSHDGTTSESSDGEVAGLSLSADGFVLSPITAPREVGDEGELTFQIQDFAGGAITEFALAHEKELHLITVRSDGSQFRHVHPELDALTGTWTIPWTWEEAGTYRIYADFTPADEGASGVTLTRTVEVEGSFQPVMPVRRQIDNVDGFTVVAEGELYAGLPSDLTFTVQQGDQPVENLEPYLGAFGHLVALREGDLAYLHVHPSGEAPQSGQNSGPEVSFTVEAPMAGPYLLYLDFQVDEEVHTATFVLDARHSAAQNAGTGPQSDDVGSQSDDADSHGDSHS